MTWWQSRLKDVLRPGKSLKIRWEQSFSDVWSCLSCWIKNGESQGPPQSHRAHRGSWLHRCMVRKSPCLTGTDVEKTKFTNTPLEEIRGLGPLGSGIPAWRLPARYIAMPRIPIEVIDLKYFDMFHEKYSHWFLKGKKRGKWNNLVIIII